LAPRLVSRGTTCDPGQEFLAAWLETENGDLGTGAGKITADYIVTVDCTHHTSPNRNQVLADADFSYHFHPI
jgi:hypothetical protein